MHRRTLRLALALALGSSVALTGCSADGTDEGATASGGDMAAPAAAPAAAAPQGLDSRSDSAKAAESSAGGGVQQARTALAPRAIVVTVGRTVRVEDVSAAVDAAGDLAERLGGRVEAEDGSVDPSDPSASQQEIVLRVPPAQVEALVDGVEDLGEVLRRTRKDTDVTQQSQDVEARLANARASVARVRQFYSEAQGVREIVLMEGELSKRVADLESLQRQYDTIRAATSLATVTVSLVGTEVAVAEEDRSGFTAGLAAGWDALTASFLVVMTVLGAVLPFAPVLAALAAALWWGRRLVRRRTTPGQAAASGA